MNTSVYEYELQEILKIWIFNLFCSNCSLRDVEEGTDTSYVNYRFVTELIDANDEEGIYSNPPNIICGCNENLYAIKSHALYDLLDSLFDRAQNKKDIMIMFKEPKISKDEEETFSYEISDEN